VDGVNRYAYGLNNPVNYIDPWGMSASSRTDTSYSTYLDMGASAFVPYYDASKSASAGNYGEAAVTAIIDTAAIIFSPESGGSSLAGGAALKGSLYGLKHADEVVSFTEAGANLVLKGSRNQKVAESAARGRQVHKDWNYGSGFEKEFTLPSGKRVDAINFETKTVVELKPNNPRAIGRGEKQVEAYRQELERVYGGSWTSKVETYD